MKKPKSRFYRFKKKAQAYIGKIRFLLYFVFVLFLPVPYYDFYAQAWTLGSVSDYEAIKSLFRGEIHPSPTPLPSFFTPLFLEVLVIAVVIAYFLASLAIKIIKYHLETDAKKVFRNIPSIKKDV